MVLRQNQENKMSNPVNYKTQAGLIKALARQSDKPMDVSAAWWFKNAEWTLINSFGWKEKDAAQFVSCYHPTSSAYAATS